MRKWPWWSRAILQEVAQKMSIPNVGFFSHLNFSIGSQFRPCGPPFRPLEKFRCSKKPPFGLLISRSTSGRPGLRRVHGSAFGPAALRPRSFTRPSAGPPYGRCALQALGLRPRRPLSCAFGLLILLLHFLPGQPSAKLRPCGPSLGLSQAVAGPPARMTA